MMNHATPIQESWVLLPFPNESCKEATGTMYKSSSYNGSRLKNSPNQHSNALWIIGGVTRLKSISLIE